MKLTLLYSVLNRFFPKLITSKMKVDFLRIKGVMIGSGTVFFDAGNVAVDYSRPELLTIGDYCKITSGTIILTHDYSRSVLRRVYGDIVGEARRTVIGDNVFIGMNSIVLMGTKIGNNTIVGAGSVCHGEYPDKSVIAGNPAKVIMHLDDYYNRRKSVYIEEAKNLAKSYIQRFGKSPSVNDMGAFFPLYLDRNYEEVKRNNLKINLSGDDSSEIMSEFLNSKPSFRSFDEFISTCRRELENENNCCSDIRIS